MAIMPCSWATKRKEPNDKGSIQAMLHEHNHFAHEFRAAGDADLPEFQLRLSSADGQLITQLRLLGLHMCIQ